METSMLQSAAKNAASTGNERILGGISTWLTSNLSEGAGATTSTGLGANARGAGTNRAFTEAQLKTVLASVWTNGGDPDCIMVGSFNKQGLSTFTGNATRFKGAEDKELVAAIDIYDLSRVH